MTSLNTSAAALSRFVVSLSSFVRAADVLTDVPKMAITATTIAANTSFLTLISFSSLIQGYFSVALTNSGFVSEMTEACEYDG